MRWGSDAALRRAWWWRSRCLTSRRPTEYEKRLFNKRSGRVAAVPGKYHFTYTNSFMTQGARQTAEKALWKVINSQTSTGELQAGSWIVLFGSEVLWRSLKLTACLLDAAGALLVLKWLPFISASEHSAGISAPVSVGDVHSSFSHITHPKLIEHLNNKVTEKRGGRRGGGVQGVISLPPSLVKTKKQKNTSL